MTRISDLTRGRIDLFSIDSLVNMLSTADLRIDTSSRRPLRTMSLRVKHSYFATSLGKAKIQLALKHQCVLLGLVKQPGQSLLLRACRIAHFIMQLFDLELDRIGRVAHI